MTSDTPDSTPPDSTTRFSNRVTDYDLARPSYPKELIDLLRTETGLGPERQVADIGSGTGIFTSLLLDTGSQVIGVEPNDAMRQAAEARLGKHAAFRSIAGTAEDTGLPEASVDVVTAAQAFHWFDLGKSSREFRRILRREGCAALIWNRRHVGTSAFLEAYEGFLEEWGRNYADVRAKWNVQDFEAQLFGGGKVHESHFPNEQRLDFEGLQSRFLSSSYAPSRDDARAPAALAALRRLFDDHALNGTVRMAYDAVVYYGRVETR